VDSKGTVFAAEGGDGTATGNCMRIRRVAQDGTVTTLTGHGGYPWSCYDGQGTSAGFRYISGLALDEQRGILYVLDLGNGTWSNRIIRAVALEDGKVTTLKTRGLNLDVCAAGLAFHRGLLLVGGHNSGRLWAVEPTTGKASLLFSDPGTPISARAPASGWSRGCPRSSAAPWQALTSSRSPWARMARSARRCTTGCSACCSWIGARAESRMRPSGKRGRSNRQSS
jgi:hypothetical protein